MKAKNTAKQLLCTRTKLYESKTSGKSIEMTIFFQFRTQLKELKQALSIESKGAKRDQAIAQLLQCFEDDKYLGTSGYPYIDSAFTDNKSTIGDSLLQYIAQYEEQHSDKVLLRDYQNYSNKKLPEGILARPYLDYQINHIIDLIFKGVDFDIQKALGLGQKLQHYVQTEPLPQEYLEDTIKDIILDSKLHTLSNDHQNIIKRKLQSFLQRPSEKGVLQLLTTFAQPGWLDQCIQQVDNRRNGIITLVALGALAFTGKQAYNILHDPFLSDTSHKVTYYQDRQDAYNEIQEHNIYYDTVDNGKYRHQMVNISSEELEAVISIQEIKDNWKKNTQLFFDELPKQNGIASYVGTDGMTYFFTQEDIQDAHKIIDEYDMRPLQKVFHAFCIGVRSSTDPEELLKPILTNISFFPLGGTVAGIQTNYSESNKIILINTSFIVHKGKANYDKLTQVLLHELIHGVFGHKPFVIATEGKTDRYTDYYIYKILKKDNFSPNDPYAPFKIADGLYSMNTHTIYSSNVAKQGFYKSFVPQPEKNYAYPSIEETTHNIDSLLNAYDNDQSPELFRTIKATKVYQLLQEYPDHIINPKIFITIVDDIDGDDIANLQSLYNKDARIFNLTPKTLKHIHRIIADYKKSKDYKQFHTAKTPQERISYFETVKKKYIGERFRIEANTPYKPGINWDGHGNEENSKVPRNIIIMVIGLTVTYFILSKFATNHQNKTKLIKQLSDKASIKTRQPEATGLVDVVIGLPGALYLMLTSITLGYYIHQKDVQHLSQVAIAFFAYYALAKIRNAVVLQRKKHVDELSNTLTPARSLVHKTHSLQDLLEYNRSAIQAYKKQVYNVITEPAPRSYINIGAHETMDATEFEIKKTLFVAETISKPIPDRITSNVNNVLGIATSTAKRSEITQGDLKIIGVGDKIDGKVNRRKSAQQQTDKLVVSPYGYKPTKPKLNKQGTMFVSICLDINYNQGTINSINATYRKRKNYFKNGDKAIQKQLITRQQEKIQEATHYIMALYSAKDLITKQIKIALTLDGKVVQIINLGSTSLGDIRNIARDIYNLHFQDYTLRTNQGFNDEQFFADHLQTVIPEEIISIGYEPSPKSFGHQVKHFKQEIGAPSIVHIIDCRGALTKDYNIPKD